MRAKAGKSSCFLEGDRQKLLAVIEAGFGSFVPFNKLVREIFNEKLSKAPAVSGAAPAVSVKV